MHPSSVRSRLAHAWPAAYAQRFEGLREGLAASRKTALVSLLRFLQTKPLVVRSALGKWWCLIGLACLWSCMLLAPPMSVCGAPTGGMLPGPDALMLFRVSNLTSWHSKSVSDLDFLVHRLLSSLPLAADPEQLIQGRGTALMCKTASGSSTMLIAREDGVRGLAEFFAALDTNRNGLLDRFEVWWLQGLLKAWLPDADDDAVHRLSTRLPRDEEGRVELDKFQASWQQGLQEQYHRFVIINGSSAPPTDPDEAAFREMYDYMNYVPIGRIEAVSTLWQVPVAGKLVCDFSSEFMYLWWDVLYNTIVAPGILLLIVQVVLKFGYDVRQRQNCNVVLFFAAIFGAYFNPLLYLCVALYLSPELGKLLSMILLLSLDEYRRFLAFVEYRVDEGLGRDSQPSDLSTVWRSDLRFVRCPLCRRLSNSSQVVRKVHAQIQPEPCCVCLVDHSEVCFACGHLCMCAGCFEGMLDHRHYDYENPPTVIGNPRGSSG